MIFQYEEQKQFRCEAWPIQQDCYSDNPQKTSETNAILCKLYQNYCDAEFYLSQSESAHPFPLVHMWWSHMHMKSHLFLHTIYSALIYGHKGHELLALLTQQGEPTGQRVCNRLDRFYCVQINITIEAMLQKRHHAKIQRPYHVVICKLHFEKQLQRSSQQLSFQAWPRHFSGFVSSV